LLGKILRINVDSESQGRKYTIPADNPFFGNLLGYKEEIYAYGFRNPWRFSFDNVTGWLWVGDVGEARREEIDIVKKGKNYGWNVMEGSLSFSGGNQIGLQLPVWEYSHDLGSAVIGGFVYRGLRLANLTGLYIYGDYGSGRIWALSYNEAVEPVNQELVDTDLLLSSFGVDEENELYMCALNGTIYRLMAGGLPSDLDGNGKVNIVDITIVAKAFGSKPGDPNWNPIADLDRNGRIDILDIAAVAKDYGKTV
jgi:hypothetical protein